MLSNQQALERFDSIEELNRNWAEADAVRRKLHAEVSGISVRDTIARMPASTWANIPVEGIHPPCRRGNHA